ncbi:MAG: hypothetical protein C0600_01605 [Ignavibacteria bacterium]|nr:MAG: hypothetical protein C0600_01605 [Ignavibacteria bacterium]
MHAAVRHRILLTAVILLAGSAPLHAQLFLEEIVVFAVDTIPKQTQVLQLGKSYEFICTGTFTFWDNDDGDSVGLVDAAYYREIPPGELGWAGLATNGNNGFLINRLPIAPLITGSGPSPTYTYTVPFLGRGAPAELFIEDHPPFSVDRHRDNHGAIRVRLFNVSPEIVIDSSAIDFGEVELGDRRDTVIVFHNEGYGPLIVGDLELAGSDPGEFAITAADEYTVNPGDSAMFTVSFIPTSIYLKEAVLRMQTNDSDSPVITIPLSGTGVTTLEAGCRADLHAPSQQYSDIPVTLFLNREGSNTTSYAFELEYDETLLIPDGVDTRASLSQGWTVDMTVLRPGRLAISASGGTPLSGTGTLFFLRCFAVWNPPPVSPMILHDLQFNSGNPRALAVDGAVEVDSLCNQHLKSVRYIGTPQLRQNHPNPFNPTTTINFWLPRRMQVRLAVYDSGGRLVRTLVDGILPSGDHSATFGAEALPSGMYVCRLEGGGATDSRRMLLLR